MSRAGQGRATTGSIPGARRGGERLGGPTPTARPCTQQATRLLPIPRAMQNERFDDDDGYDEDFDDGGGDDAIY